MDGLNFLDGVPGSAAVEDSKAADHPTVYLPYICVSAAPWTNITNDDEFVSHAISLFLTWDHPWYNCIERSSFLGAMGEARLLDSKVMPESEFCSPSLVNAIIALGCLHSRHPTAFETSGNAKTRGRHFLKLADELLEHEILHRKPKIATLSSMFLNLTAHGIHGEPVFGTEKFEEFYRIYDDLRLGDPHTLPPDYYINRDVRARFDAISEITWGLYCQDVSHSITGGHPPRLNRPQIAQTFAFKANGKSSHYDDSTMEADGCIMYDPNDTWWPYPHPGIPEPSRVKECLKAKCDLSNLVQDMWDCIDSPESPAWLKHDSGEPGKVQRAMDIFDKLKLWKTKLPEPLAPGGSTLPHVMLLRGYYDTVVINLFRSMQEARVLLDGTYSTLHHEIEHPRTYVFTHCISLAATTAEFRNRYTLFRHWLTMQFAWAVAWTLLFHLDAAFGEPTTDAFVDAVRALRELAQKFELAAQVVVTLRKMAEDYEVELPPRAVRWLYPVDRLRQRQRQLQLQHQHQRQGAGGDRRRRATATSADAAELADALALLDEVKMDDPDQVLSDIRIPVTIPKRYRTDGHKHLKGRGTFGPEIADVMTNLRAMHIADDD
ncbi:hypothetical protein BDY21DRAFT_86949 [Lineolata rhizophorae]|uniref:Transcription factor domain-containing protein n=1 Tax=Lineolata rhizophorae TaxID=578093 RepID=A0A6A6PC44_9PEZI|nr:hypothetical protein BDY21DRAFT_86949 [Lineolata rhizophorae]